MVSRKMALMNLSAGQQWTPRHTDQPLVTMKEGAGGMN